MYHWGEPWSGRRRVRVDLDWGAPGAASIGRGGQGNLIEVVAVEARVLPDDVELASRRIDGRLGNDVARSDRLPGIGIAHEDGLHVGDDLRLRPGVAAIRRLYKGGFKGGYLGGGGDQVEEGGERAWLGVGHDLVADRLLTSRDLPGELGACPAHSPLVGL